MADARAYNALYGGVLDEQPLSYRTPLRQPNALMGPVWENNHAAPQQAPQRPSDWAVSSGVAETISPAIGMYGLGAGLGSTYAAAKAGDYGGALESALPLAAIFAGPGARTSNKVNLLRAQEMQSKGMPREAIHRDTGWFHGVDGKWRFEIDDASLKAVPGDGGVSHAALAAAYPDMRYFSDVSIGNASVGGFMADGGRVGGKPYSSISVRGPADQLQRIAGHELQHKVQLDEGFAHGGNTESPPSNIVALNAHRSLFDAARSDPRNALIPDPVLWDTLSPAADKRARADSYWKLAGEVEARAVEKRIDLTPEQRRARPPWLDYDVPESQQIVRMESGNVQNSLMPAAAEKPKGDPVTIEIMRKYGLLGPMAGGVGVNALMQDQNQ